MLYVVKVLCTQFLTHLNIFSNLFFPCDNTLGLITHERWLWRVLVDFTEMAGQHFHRWTVIFEKLVNLLTFYEDIKFWLDGNQVNPIQPRGQFTSSLGLQTSRFLNRNGNILYILLWEVWCVQAAPYTLEGTHVFLYVLLFVAGLLGRARHTLLISIFGYQASVLFF